VPAFEYQALDAAGRRRKGVAEGDTARIVRARLRQEGLTPLEVEEVAEQRSARTAGAGPVRGGRGIRALDLALATRQMATLARAGLPVEEILGTVARQTEKAFVRNVLTAVRTRVMEGHGLAAAMGAFPRVFPELYRTTVASGEQSGHLDLVLERLADYTETRNTLHQKITLALFYPIILTLVAIGVTAALLVYVVPEVVQVFTGIGQELPWLTRALIASSDALRDHGLWVLAVLVVGGLLTSRLLRREAWRFRFHALLLRLPLIGRLTRGIQTARFARTLSILAASGVPVLEALRTGGEVIGNLPMRAAVASAAQRVREGSGIGRALEQTGYFPPMTVHLIKSGESSGKLNEMLDRAAQTQERELETRIGMVVALFEPLLIVTMGAVVLTIVLAILLPIFEMNQLVN
jgi:general secretion pathway protein F